MASPSMSGVSALLNSILPSRKEGITSNETFRSVSSGLGILMPFKVVVLSCASAPRI